MNAVMNVTQFIFTIIIGLYFFNQLVASRGDQNLIATESKEEMERLHFMRRHTLTKPLTEQTRPKKLSEIVGQEDGVRALSIALGGENPQHILIYGSPGVGKTAAARVVLEQVKQSEKTPFDKNAPFIEVDATTMHYDERCIADPLMGSVHDPIYQGAGAYGNAGVPQVKEGAVTRAHGGVLFIDEIGELSTMQMNRLLKVLEDGRVLFESSYYNKQNKQIPRHVKDVFENGLPADFRLVGATTRSPKDIPPALRSRCVEIYFNDLSPDNLKKIIKGAVEKLNIFVSDELISFIASFSKNGRDCVKITEMIGAKLENEKRTRAEYSDVEWVIKTGRY